MMSNTFRAREIRYDEGDKIFSPISLFDLWDSLTYSHFYINIFISRSTGKIFLNVHKSTYFIIHEKFTFNIFFCRCRTNIKNKSNKVI